jgi:hypothetical protein
VKNFFLLFLVFFTFKANATNRYSWYYNKPRDNDLYLYGVGSSEINKEHAIKKAMDNIAKNIFDNNSEILNINYESFRNSLNFSNYSVENSATNDGILYVLISVKRNELFELQINDLNEIDKIITKKYNFLKDKNEFIRAKNIEKLLKLIKKAENKIEVIWTINEFNETKYTEKYKRIVNEYIKLSKNLNLNIKIENPEITHSKEALKYYFSKKDIKYSRHSVDECIKRYNLKTPLER